MAPMSATRLISFGTLAAAIACAAATIINFVWYLPEQFSKAFSITFWILTVDIVLLCALLALGSISRHEKVLHHFGFMQYSAGTGMLLIFIGSLVLGMAGNVGLISGATSIGIGGLSIVVHFATEPRGEAARTEPLLTGAGG